MGVDTSKLSAEDFKTYFSILCETQNWNFDLLWNAVAGYGQRRASEAVQMYSESSYEIATRAVREYKAYLEYCRSSIRTCVCKVYDERVAEGTLDKNFHGRYIDMSERIISILRAEELLDTWIELPVGAFADQYGVGPEMISVFRDAQKIAKADGLGKPNFDFVCFKNKGTSGFHEQVDCKENEVRRINSTPWHARHHTMKTIMQATAKKYGISKAIATRCVNRLLASGVYKHWPKATNSELLNLRDFGTKCVELTEYAQQAFNNGEFDYLNE